MMSIKRNLATVALAGVFATPLYAQIVIRNDPTQRTPRTRVEDRTTVDSRTGVEGRRGDSQRSSVTIPPGHLPPRGMCRVWIDGVPPGLQPAVTDCATAERNRVANSRVIYGDRESFPGKAKGKFKRADADREGRRCSMQDGVVVDGRVINICRDTTMQSEGRGR